MKTLLVIDSLGAGGAERSTAAQVPYLIKAGIQLEIIVFYSYPHGFLEHVKKNGVRVHELTGLSFFDKVRAVRSIMNIFSPVILHSILMESNFVCRLASIGKKVVYVESLVNTSYSKDRIFASVTYQIKHSIIKVIDKLTLPLVDHFHSVGESVKDHYIKEMGLSADRIVVIHRGREKNTTTLDSDYLRRSLGIKPDECIIIAIGRHEFQKGFLEILKSVNQLKTKFKVLIAGREGQATREMVTYIESNKLEEKVTILGYRADVPNLLAIADIYVSASYFEGLPGGALEAMAAGLPLLLRSIPENREVAVENENALFFDAQFQLLSNQLNRLLTDEALRKKLGHASKNIFLKNFLIEAKAEQMADFYKSLNDK